MHPMIAKLQAKYLKKVPRIQAGYTVRVSQKVKEGDKERVQRFEGLVIRVSHGTGAEKTITVRKIVEGIGVEKIFPLHSTNVTEIHIVKKAKVRRGKLYYMRERFGKSARLSEKHVTDKERAEEEKKMEAFYEEAMKNAALNEEKAESNEAEVAQEPAATESVKENVKASEPVEAEEAPQAVATEKKEEAVSEKATEEEKKD